MALFATFVLVGTLSLKRVFLIDCLQQLVHIYLVYFTSSFVPLSEFLSFYYSRIIRFVPSLLGFVEVLE